MNFGSNNWHPLQGLSPAILRAIIYRSFTQPSLLTWYRFQHYEQRYLLEDAGLIKSIRNNTYSPWHHCVYSTHSYCVVCRRVGKTELGTSRPIQLGCIQCGENSHLWQVDRFHEWRDIYQVECMKYLIEWSGKHGN